MKVTIQLTADDLRLIALILAEKPFKQIAPELGLSLSGVKWRVRGLYARLGLRTRFDLAKWALRNKVLGEQSAS